MTKFSACFPSRWCCIAGLFLGVVGPVAARNLAELEDLKRLSLEELLEIKVISVSRSPESWKSTPAAIAVITQEEIHGAGVVRLADALRLAPGLHTARYSASSYAITARGFNSTSSNKMQVLLDGRSLYTPLLSGVFWEVQDTLLEDLDRIEVVRGPGATMWGSNAVNGVINIVTKNAKDTQGVLVTGGMGTEEKSFGGLRYGGKLGGETYYRTYFKFLKRDDQVFASGARNGDSMQQQQGGFRLDTSLAGGNSLTLQGDLYFNHFGVAGRPDAKNNGGNLLGRWRHEFSPVAELQVQAYFDRNSRDVPLQFKEQRTTYDVDVQQHFRLGEQHQLTVGGNHRSSEDTTAQGNRTFIFLPQDRTLALTSLFLQDKFTLIPEELTLYFGSKFEHNDFTGWEVQPNLRVAHVPARRQLVWAAVSRAVRAPTRVDADSRFMPNPSNGFVLIQGNPAFRSEEVTAFEFGYRVQPHDRLFFDFALFRNDYDELRTLEPLPPGAPLLISNLREGTTQGAELAVTFQGTHWNLTGSYTYFDEKLRLKPGSRDTIGASLEGLDPPYLATLQLAVIPAQNFQVNVVLRHVARRPNSPTPRYTGLDLRVAWHPDSHWELALVGHNLLDSRHAEFSGGGNQPQVQRGFFGQFSYRY